MIELARNLQATGLSVALQTAPWIVPTLQIIHIIALSLVFGSILMVALRVLGRVRTDESLLAVLDRFGPWMWWALLINLVTGALLTLAEPVREFTATSYWVKMALILLGVAGALAFRRSLGSRETLARGDPPIGAGLRAGAVATIVLWIAIIFLGRAIAYDIEVWGAWSLVHRA